MSFIKKQQLIFPFNMVGLVFSYRSDWFIFRCWANIWQLILRQKTFLCMSGSKMLLSNQRTDLDFQKLSTQRKRICTLQCDKKGVTRLKPACTECIMFMDTLLLSISTWFLQFSSLKYRVWWNGFFS